MFRLFQKKNPLFNPPKNPAFMDACDALELKIIALMDIMDILRALPLEVPVPYYLVKRLDVHVLALSGRYGIVLKSG